MAEQYRQPYKSSYQSAVWPIFLRLRESIPGRTRRDPLKAPLGRLDDGAIDAALENSDLGRRDLFVPGATSARHRVQISLMMATLGIRLDHAVRDNWRGLKRADHRCAYCPSRRRCKQWLRLGLKSDAPRRFCPNATFFAHLMNKQDFMTRKDFRTLGK